MQELVRVRWGRMLASPFSFYRGAALPMASDLSTMPGSGLPVQACGDAHLSNFGSSAPPERRWSSTSTTSTRRCPARGSGTSNVWAASLEVAARANGFAGKDRRKIVAAAVGRYREAMRDFAGMTNLDVWYAHADMDQLLAQFKSQLDKRQRTAVSKGLAKARTRDSMQELREADPSGGRSAPDHF